LRLRNYLPEFLLQVLDGRVARCWSNISRSPLFLISDEMDTIGTLRGSQQVLMHTRQLGFLQWWTGSEITHLTDQEDL
jgi:hypothetical protein